MLAYPMRAVNDFSIFQRDHPCHGNDRIVRPAHELPGALSRAHGHCSKNPYPLLGFPSENRPAALVLFYVNVANHLSLSLAPVTKRVCQPRGITVLQRLPREHFQSLADQYELKHAMIYRRCGVEPITAVVEKFVFCGLNSQGVARIQCTNPERMYEYFRPFSCRSFYFCRGRPARPVPRNGRTDSSEVDETRSNL
jgi:hypothetical protein